MKAHIVLAHPEGKSFNGQLANITNSKLEAAGWEVTYSDLYANNFDPREGPMHYPIKYLIWHLLSRIAPWMQAKIPLLILSTC